MATDVLESTLIWSKLEYDKLYAKAANSVADIAILATVS
jgi:hypothetical protein